MDSLITLYGLEQHLTALMIGLPRILLLFMITPFMGGELLAGQVKTGVVFAFYLFIHPVILHQIPPDPELHARLFSFYLPLVLKEIMIGFLLAYLSGIIFWAVQSAGFLIDNQRGASMASLTDPLSGQESSPVGSLFFQSIVFLFFSGGAFLTFLSAFYSSYVIWPVISPFPVFFRRCTAFLCKTGCFFDGTNVVAGWSYCCRCLADRCFFRAYQPLCLPVKCLCLGHAD